MDLSDMNIRELAALKEKIEREMKRKHEEVNLDKDSLLLCSKISDIFAEQLAKNGSTKSSVENICHILRKEILHICDITFANYKTNGPKMYCKPNLWDVDQTAYANMVEEIISIMAKYSMNKRSYDPLINENYEQWKSQFHKKIEGLYKEEK